MRSNSKVRLGIVTAMAGLLLASCGGENGSKTEVGPSQSTKPAAIDTNKAVELTVYSILSGTYESFMELEGKYIQKKYPNYTFKFIPPGAGSTLKDMVTAGTNIDIIISTPDLQPVIDVKLESDISDLVAKYKYDLNRFIPVTIDSMKKIAGGRLLGFPGRVSSYTMYYNKDLFDKFGVPYVTDKMTWEDIQKTAKLLTRLENGVQYYGFAGDIIAMLDMNERAPQYVDPQTKRATLSNDYWKGKFDRIVPLYTMVPGDANFAKLTNITNSRNMFLKDMTVAMLIGVNDAGSRLQTEKWEMNWDIVPFPAFKDAPKEGPQPSTRNYLLSANSKHRDEAFLAISELVSDVVQKELVTTGVIPSLQKVDYLGSLASGVPAMKGKNVKALVPNQYGEMNQKDQFYIAARAELISSFNLVISGKKDVNTAIRDAEEAANKKITGLLEAAK